MALNQSGALACSRGGGEARICLGHLRQPPDGAGLTASPPKVPFNIRGLRCWLCTNYLEYRNILPWKTYQYVGHPPKQERGRERERHIPRSIDTGRCLLDPIL